LEIKHSSPISISLQSFIQEKGWSKDHPFYFKRNSKHLSMVLRGISKNSLSHTTITS
jgi:hypothetical protein